MLLKQKKVSWSDFEILQEIGKGNLGHVVLGEIKKGSNESVSNSENCKVAIKRMDKYEVW
jgi:hypothetical protein